MGSIIEWKIKKKISVIYFVTDTGTSVTMLNMFTMNYDSHEIIDFPETTIGRNLLKEVILN
jgi:hypothetical protein